LRLNYNATSLIFAGLNKGFMALGLGIVITMANEKESFEPFIKKLTDAIAIYQNVKVFILTDNASKDNTPELCKALAQKDSRFYHEHNTRVRNIVQAKMRVYELAHSHDDLEFILEIDAGLSHNPEAIPLFVDAYQKGYKCVYGSRFVKGGSMNHDSGSRKFLSRWGTISSNLLLGTKLKDMTSGYQGFSTELIGKGLYYEWRSIAHFHQTEMRYLYRKNKQIEIPITYIAPSPNVSSKSIRNSISCLLYYFFNRITFKAKSI
jgi:dolichol-phosphate mannosyltransferase